MGKVLGFLLGFLLFLYPFGIYFGMQHFGPRVLSALLFLVFALRYVLSKGKVGALKLKLLMPMSVLGAVFCLLVFLLDQEQALKFYPVIMNLFFFCVFLYSLKNPPPLIERVARLMEPELPPRGVLHARQVTIAWSVFFVVNGGLAFYTALYSSMEFWTLYNGLLSYLLMGLMFAVEYGVRRVRMGQDRREAETC